MRIWSLHPKYLDGKGLVALWREGLLALAVLSGKTKGYKNHPQLNRFRTTEYPIDAIKCYLYVVLQEAQSRNYRFDASKTENAVDLISNFSGVIAVTQGQLSYEMNHLILKLTKRSPNLVSGLIPYSRNQQILCHPLFHPIEGVVESFEKIIS